MSGTLEHIHCLTALKTVVTQPSHSIPRCLFIGEEKEMHQRPILLVVKIRPSLSYCEIFTPKFS